MTENDFTIKLTRDQALVLSDWLDRMIGTAEFDGLVDQDRAVWSPIYKVSGTLETSLVEVFMRTTVPAWMLPGSDSWILSARSGGRQWTSRSAVGGRISRIADVGWRATRPGERRWPPH